MSGVSSAWNGRCLAKKRRYATAAAAEKQLAWIFSGEKEEEEEGRGGSSREHSRIRTVTGNRDNWNMYRAHNTVHCVHCTV